MHLFIGLPIILKRDMCLLLFGIVGLPFYKLHLHLLFSMIQGISNDSVKLNNLVNGKTS